MASLLFITAFPPNKRTAGQNYTRQLLDDLVENNKVDLIYWDFPGHDLEVSAKVNVITRVDSDKMKLAPFRHFWLFPLFSKRYSKKVEQWIIGSSDNYDLIYFDFSQTFILARNLKHPLKIGMCHDIISQKFERHKVLKFLLPWIRWSEKYCLKGLDKLFTFSKKDSDILKSLYNRDSEHVNFYIERNILDMDMANIHLGDYFIMYGAWNRKENQQSIQWALDNIAQSQFNIKIIGGGMPKELLDRIEPFQNMEYLGFVDDPYPIIAGSKGLIAPLFNGAGVKVKVIECLALGTPVVGTDVTFEGIENIPFRNVGSLINVSDKNIGDLLKDLLSVNLKEKLLIRDSFLERYNSSKFIDRIEVLKHNK